MLALASDFYCIVNQHGQHDWVGLAYWVVFVRIHACLQPDTSQQGCVCYTLCFVHAGNRITEYVIEDKSVVIVVCKDGYGA